MAVYPKDRDTTLINEQSSTAIMIMVLNNGSLSERQIQNQQMNKAAQRHAATCSSRTSKQQKTSKRPERREREGGREGIH